jgi:hypothetical protein
MDKEHTVRMAIAVAVALMIFVPFLASADTRIERQLDLEPGGMFRIDTDSGSVSVVGSSESGVQIVLTSSRDDLEERFEMEFSSTGQKAEVRVERKGRLFNWWNRGDSMHFEIRVARQVEVSVDTSGGRIDVEGIDGKADLRTSGGGIGVENVRGDLLADTSGGGIEVSGVDGDVRADTSGGSISISDVSGKAIADTSGGGIKIRDVAGAIVADTSGGGIRIEGAGDSVRADTSGGPVLVEFVPGNDMGGTLSSSGGRVTAVIDPGVSLEIDASTSGGSVYSDVPLTIRGEVSKSKIHGTINGGGALLKLRSSGGGIRIESN